MAHGVRERHPQDVEEKVREVMEGRGRERERIERAQSETKRWSSSVWSVFVCVCVSLSVKALLLSIGILRVTANVSFTRNLFNFTDIEKNTNN